MTTPLINQIKYRLQEKGISVYALEKMAGLTPNALRHILIGKSKNPSVELVYAISNVLECSIYDLLGKKDLDESKIDKKEKSDHISERLLSEFNINLRKNDLILLEILSFVLRNHSETFSKTYFPDVLNCIEEIYFYSLHKNKGVFSKTFAQKTIEKFKSKSA